MKYLKYAMISAVFLLPLTVSCATTNKYGTGQNENVFNYTLVINSNGELIVKDEKGNIIEGVCDDRPIKRIVDVKTFTIIEGVGSHFIQYNGLKHYLPGPHPPRN